MAVTSITVTQDNKIGEVNLLSVHNPLVFLIDVAYTSSVPETLYVELQDGSATVLGTFAAIPYQDSALNSIRTFAFFATDILKSYMGEYDDFESGEKLLEYVDGITFEFTLRFYIGQIESTVSFVAMHAARQFGDSPCLESIFNNEDETYYAGVGMPVYVYIYNDHISNVITVNTPELLENRLLTYNNIPLLTFDNQYLITS